MAENIHNAVKSRKFCDELIVSLCSAALKSCEFFNISVTNLLPCLPVKENQ